MIKDKLSNSKDYYQLSENIKNGFLWLEQTDLKNLADGKYEIDGDNLYASIQTYETKIDALYENHQNYIDIQYMIKGIEKIGVTDISNCMSEIRYNKEKDIEFYKIQTKEEFLELPEDYFVILYPQDAHKPSICIDKQDIVKKVVVKVKI